MRRWQVLVARPCRVRTGEADVTAPGVAILSATVRVGSADANTGTMFDPTGYVHASGTSFSGPRRSAVAIVKQVIWITRRQIRAALMNTSTNLRNASRAAKADGLTAVFNHRTGSRTG